MEEKSLINNEELCNLIIEMFNQKTKIEGNIYCFIVRFEMEHEGEDVTNEIAKIDRLKSKGLITNDERLKKTLEIIREYYKS